MKYSQLSSFHVESGYSIPVGQYVTVYGLRELKCFFFSGHHFIWASIIKLQIKK